jgi:hypothetical protein
MNSSIRSSRPNDLNPILGNLGRFIFKNFLYSGKGGLPLPSKVLGSIVFQSQFDSGHALSAFSQFLLKKSDRRKAYGTKI